MSLTCPNPFCAEGTVLQPVDGLDGSQGNKCPECGTVYPAFDPTAPDPTRPRPPRPRQKHSGGPGRPGRAGGGSAPSASNSVLPSDGSGATPPLGVGHFGRGGGGVPPLPELPRSAPAYGTSWPRCIQQHIDDTTITPGDPMTGAGRVMGRRWPLGLMPDGGYWWFVWQVNQNSLSSTPLGHVQGIHKEEALANARAIWPQADYDWKPWEGTGVKPGTCIPFRIEVQRHARQPTDPDGPLPLVPLNNPDVWAAWREEDDEPVAKKEPARKARHAVPNVLSLGKGRAGKKGGGR